MPDREPDLATLLEDVKTIKAILQNQDAPFPQVWKALYTAATAMVVAGLLQYFVPFFRSLDFDGRVLWLWLPGVLIMFPVILAILLRELKLAGKAILSQSRVRHLLYARWVIPPAALILIWTASRNPQFGLEGITLIVISMWQVVLEQIIPEGFRPVPLAYLGLGCLELIMNWRGDEVVLFNVVLVAATLVFAGTLLRRSVKPAGENR